MVDWSAIRLAVFDMDGTLYDQRAIRISMAMRLLGACLTRRSPQMLWVIGQYRSAREKLGVEDLPGFEAVLLSRVARQTDLNEREIARIAAEWLEHRPLPLLRRARRWYVNHVFAALRHRGIIIGVWSDYPPADKLDALGLEADIQTWSGHPGVARLKPNPRGLLYMMEQAGASPGQTVMIGDRDDRDGEASRRSGVPALILSSRPIPGVATFRSFADEPFAALVQSCPPA